MKKLFLIAGAAILLVAGVLVAIPAMLSSNTLRSNFAAQLSSITGSQIALNGPVRFSIVPDFGIVAEDVAISTPDRSVSVSVQRAVAAVRLGSLLSDQIRITGIELEQPAIVLQAGKGAAAQPSEMPAGESDIFKTAAAVLGRLSIDQIKIVEGVVSQATGDRTEEIAGNVNLTMAIPGVDEESSITFSGNLGGRDITADATIASLGQLLQRQPTALSIATTASPAPHPAVESLSVTGNIQLADDGSYRIEAGRVMTLDQPMRLDATYRPGIRPYVTASVNAKVLNFADFQPKENAAPAASGSSGSNSGSDLSALAGFDADLKLRVETATVGKVKASGLTFKAALKDGRLDSTLAAGRIAGGALSNRVIADLTQSAPEIQGAVRMSSVRMKELAAFAGVQIPATGEIGTELQYAFIGTSEAAIKSSLNLAGNLTISNGDIRIPALGSVAGPKAETISSLNLTADIKDIESPVGLDGSMAWNGENVSVAAQILPLEFLTARRGAASVSIASRLLNGRFDGTIGLDATASGKTSLKSASLSKLLSWLGQKADTPLGRFSYDGNISVSDGELAFEQARISLDDAIARGAAKISTKGKTTIFANLSVDDLDLASLTGGAGTAGKSNAGNSAETPIDLSMLRSIDAEFFLNAGRIGYGKLVAGPVQAKLSVKNGVAKLALPGAGFYNGKLQATIVADGSRDVPAIDLDMNMEAVDALPLFDSAADFTRLEGKLDAALSTRGTGRTTKQLAASLNGQSKVRFADGALRGIDVAKIVNNLQSIFISGYQENSSDRTEFSELSVSMNIQNGIASTSDLKLLGPLVRMTGEGQIDLAQQTIDMRLNPKLVGTLDGQGGEFDVAGVGMPIIVSGPLSGPRIYPDLANLLANPEAALQNLTNLKGSIKALKGGKIDASKIVKDQLGLDKLGAGGEAISGVVDRLTGQSGEGNAPVSTKDVVGSVIEGLIGGNAQQPAVAAQQPSQPDQGAYIPVDDVPVPTPNPRRSAGVQQPAPAPEQPKPLADQLVDKLIPKAVPEDQRDNAGELLKGLFGSFGKQ